MSFMFLIKGTIIMDQKPVGEKLEKIAREMEEAGASKWETVKVIKRLIEEAVPEQKLRENAIAMLAELNKAAAEVMESFEKLKVYTSADRLENFDRGNIIRSLLRETKISRALAEKIGSEVEDRLKDLKAGFLNTALIRELVNVKLLEYGQEGIREEYVRLGMPVYDVGKKLEDGFFENAEILKEYYILKVIPAKPRERFFGGEINIGEIGDFGNRLFSGTLAIKESNAQGIVPGIYAEFAEKQKFFSMPLNIPSINMQIATAIGGMSEKKIDEFSAFLAGHLARLCTANKGRGDSCIGIDIFADEKFGLGQERKDAAINFGIKLFNDLGKYCNSGYTAKVSVDSKYKTKIMKKEMPEKEISFINCSNGRVVALNDSFYCNGKGISGFFGINLDVVAEKYKDGFNEKSEEILLEIRELNDLKNALLSKRKYLGDNGILIGDFQPGLGVYGAFSAQQKIRDVKAVEGFFSSAPKILGKNWTVIEMILQDSAGKPAEVSGESNDYIGDLISKKSLMGKRNAGNAAQLEELLGNGICEVVFRPS